MFSIEINSFNNKGIIGENKIFSNKKKKQLVHRSVNNNDYYLKEEKST